MNEFEEARKKLDAINNKILTSRNMNTTDKVHLGAAKKKKDPKFHQSLEERKNTDWAVNVRKACAETAKSANTIEKISGANNYKYGGAMIGTNVETGIVEYVLHGEKQLKENGFMPSAVYNVIKGKKKKHKGYYWHREKP